MLAVACGGDSPAPPQAIPNPPAAPTALTATAVSSTQIDLAWTDNSNNEVGFRIERDDGAGFNAIATPAADTTAYSDTSLTPNTSYSYRVFAYNTGGDSSPTNTAVATTPPAPPTPPADPTSLTATAVSPSGIDLAWTDNSTDEDGFRVERDDGAGFATIATLTANVTAYPDTGLASNTSYSYRVFAFNIAGDSNPTNTASATTFVAPPADPTALTATAVSSTQIDLAWTDNSTNEDGFRVERDDGAGFAEIVVLGANITAYTDLGRTPNTTYSYRVRAYNVGGNSGYSNVAQATTPPVPPTPPGDPTNLTATAISATRIDLAWTDNSTNEDGFRIERDDGAGFNTIATVAANITVYSNTGLTPNTSYSYRVFAFNIAGDSAPTNTASATTPVVPPAAPTTLTATTFSQTRIDLAWVDNSTNETGFRVERDDGAGFNPIATLAANVTTYSNTGLTANTSYTYRVFAFNTGGDSNPTNTASATTLPNPPADPTLLTATAASSTVIDLAWTDNSTDETGFRIERDDGAGFNQIATVAANVTSYSNTGLTASTSYSYRVFAFNTGGDSNPTNTASATTPVAPPADPTTLTATTFSQTQIDLAWVDNSTDETGFRVERDDGTGFNPIATLAANVTTYPDTGLTANTSYTYRVFAYNAGGDSNPTNTATATTLPNLPADPTVLTATAASSTVIDLAWTDNSTNEDGFRIERDDGAGFNQIATVAADVVVYSDTGLTPATSYTYRVFAYNIAGDSNPTNTASATTLVPPPADPTTLTATTFSQTQIDLAWSDNSTDETGFRVERDDGAGFNTIATLAANITSYPDTGLTANTSYTYRVFAFNAGGDSNPTNTATATTLPNPPADPTVLTATAVSQTQIDLAWTDNSTNEDGFRIERDDGAGFNQIATVAANVTTYPDTGLTPATSYSYRVFAFNTGGDSNPTNTASTSTLAGTTQWERLIDGTWLGETDKGGDVAVDATGVYVCGTLESSTGGDDIYVAKLDLTNGTTIWSQTIDGGNNGDDAGLLIVLQGTKVYAAGAAVQASGDSAIWAAELDATTGAIAWQQTRPGLAGSSSADAIAADASGVYLAGSTTDILANNTDVLILRFAAGTGVLDWEYTADGGGSDSDQATSLAVDASGVYAGGTVRAVAGDSDPWIIKLNLSGAKQWEARSATGGSSVLALGLTLGGSRVFLHWGQVIGARWVWALDTATGAGAWETLLSQSAFSLNSIFIVLNTPTRSIAWDSGTVYVAGEDASGSGTIIFHALADTTGVELWSANTSIVAKGMATRLIVEPGVGLYAAGYGASTSWITKRSLADGSSIWEQGFAPNVTQVTGLALGSLAVYGAGTTRAGDTQDIWVKSLSPADGSSQWERPIDGTWFGETDRGGDVAVDATGVYICGTLQTTGTGDDIYVAKLDLTNGTTIWSQTIDGGSNGDDAGTLIVLQGTSVYAAGTAVQASGDSALWAAEFDATTGAITWQQTRPGLAGNSTADAIAADASGVYLAGSTTDILANNTDVLILRFAAGTGVLDWEYTADGGASDTDMAWALAVDSTAVYAGGSVSAVTGNLDPWMIKLNLSGVKQWEARSTSGTGTDLALGLAVGGGRVFLHWGTAIAGRWVWALDTATGAGAWEVQLSQSYLSIWSLSAARSLVWDSGTLYVGGEDNVSATLLFHALADTTGIELWSASGSASAKGMATRLIVEPGVGLYAAGYGASTSWITKRSLADGSSIWEQGFAPNVTQVTGLALGSLAVYGAGTTRAGDTQDLWIKQVNK